MEALFLKLVNLSITATYLALAVMLLRLILKKAPRWIICILWGLVALRLICPFSIESVFSLLPSSEPIPQDFIYTAQPQITSGLGVIDNTINPILSAQLVPAAGDSVNPTQVLSFVLSIVWLVGLCAMLAYALVSCLLLKRKVRTATLLEGNIRQSEFVDSPFVFGIFRPVIYLPYRINNEDLPFVIAHEQAHIKRRDNWWKPFGFLLLSVYWFNPVLWISYILLCRDIEAACDERVIQNMQKNELQAYSTALLNCSIHRRRIAACPLAFGEAGVKDRIKNVMNYKKPAFWIIAVAVIACIAAAVCFLTSPKKDTEPDTPGNTAFIAIVKEIRSGGSMIVVSCDDNQEYSVPLEKMESSPEPEAGDTVQIVHTGDILETYPLGLNYVIGIKVIEDISESMADTTSSAEQSAIRGAIIAHNQSKDPTGLLCCASFVPLETVSGTPLAGSNTRRVIYYGWALYEEYMPSGVRLAAVSSSHVPAVLTFDINEDDQYLLAEYWEPRDGTYYMVDMMDKVPDSIRDDMMDSQKFILRQKQECYALAINASGLDPDISLEWLLNTVMDGPATASAPAAYINAHPDEYRECLYYGAYALKYCFTQFEKGDQTDFAGRILMQLCDDIATSMGESGIIAQEYLTAEQWYKEFKNNALLLKEQYPSNKLVEIAPASYLLLSILGEE